MKKVLSLLLASTFALALLCVANVKAEGEETETEKVSLTVHYQKFTGAYENAGFYGWTWTNGIGTGDVFKFTGVDDFGAYRTVEIPKSNAHADGTNEEGASLLIFFNGITYFEGDATEGAANWSILDNFKSQGGNLSFDDVKYGAAWETGEVHLWYCEGMTLASGYNVAVSDGSAEGKAAAMKEAVAYHVVTDEESGKSTPYGYLREGYKAIRIIMTFPDNTAFYNEDGTAAYDCYSWGNGLEPAVDVFPLALTMTAIYNGAKATYGIFYAWVPNAYESGLGLIPRTAGSWAAQTGNLDNGNVAGFDQAIIDTANDGLLEVAILFGQQSTDFRVGSEAVAAWVVEVNSLRVTEAYFDAPDVVYVTVSKDVPVSDELTTARFVVKAGEETVAIDTIRYDAAASLVTKFRLELAAAIDPTKVYKVFVNFTIDGVLYENDKAIECDTTAPTIECSDKVTANICSGTFALPTIVVTDTNDGSIKQWYFKTGEGYNTTVDTGKVGEYKITVGAKDKMGNEALKDIIVEVVDNNASTSNANAGLALLGLLPTAVIGLVAFRKYAM